MNVVHGNEDYQESLAREDAVFIVRSYRMIHRLRRSIFITHKFFGHGWGDWRSNQSDEKLWGLMEPGLTEEWLDTIRCGLTHGLTVSDQDAQNPLAYTYYTEPGTERIDRNYQGLIIRDIHTSGGALAESM